MAGNSSPGGPEQGQPQHTQGVVRAKCKPEAPRSDTKGCKMAAAEPETKHRVFCMSALPVGLAGRD